MILKLAGPLTLFVNGLLGDTDALDDETAMELWTDAFKMDWQGDLALLPDVRLTADNGLLLAHSRSMYDRLCKRLPQHTEASRARDDAYFNYSHNPLEPISFDCCRLLLIPMRHGWFDLVDFKYPIALARLAFRFGCLDLLKHLERPYTTLQEWIEDCDLMSDFWTSAVIETARHGHLDVLIYLLGRGVTGCTKAAMDGAAANGHLHVVKWLHENRIEGCTAWAMDRAAVNSHLHVVIWLHANRTEGCTTKAMDWAACEGHLHVIKWLHANRTEGCTTKAMDKAAVNGHFDVFKWLHENRTEGCTIRAMYHAADRGRLDMVQWLHEIRGEACTSAALDAAISRRHLDIVKYMHSKGGRASDRGVRSAASWGDIEMLQYLLDHGYAVGLDTLDWARTAEAADILLGSLTLEQAQTLLAKASRRDNTMATIERLESTIYELQASSMCWMDSQESQFE